MRIYEKKKWDWNILSNPCAYSVPSIIPFLFRHKSYVELHDNLDCYGNDFGMLTMFCRLMWVLRWGIIYAGKVSLPLFQQKEKQCHQPRCFSCAQRAGRVTSCVSTCFTRQANALKTSTSGSNNTTNTWLWHARSEKCLQSRITSRSWL